MRNETPDNESTACSFCGSDSCLSICAKRLLDQLQLFCKALQDLLLAYRLGDPELGNLLETMLRGTKNWRDQVNRLVAFECDQENDSVH